MKISPLTQRHEQIIGLYDVVREEGKKAAGEILASIKSDIVVYRDRIGEAEDPKTVPLFTPIDLEKIACGIRRQILDSLDSSPGMRGEIPPEAAATITRFLNDFALLTKPYKSTLGFAPHPLSEVLPIQVLRFLNWTCDSIENSFRSDPPEKVIDEWTLGKMELTSSVLDSCEALRDYRLRELRGSLWLCLGSENLLRVNRGTVTV